MDAVSFLRLRFFGLGTVGCAALWGPAGDRALSGQPGAGSFLSTAVQRAGDGAQSNTLCFSATDASGATQLAQPGRDSGAGIAPGDLRRRSPGVAKSGALV